MLVKSDWEKHTYNVLEFHFRIHTDANYKLKTENTFMQHYELKRVAATCQTIQVIFIHNSAKNFHYSPERKLNYVTKCNVHQYHE